jgi:hypothetical protein
VTLAVRRYEPGDRERWDSFVAEARSAHFLFRRGYMDYHSDRFVDHSLMVFDGARLVALLPANLAGSQLVSHGGLTFGGFLTDATLSTRRMLAVFDAATAYLRASGIDALVYKAVPHIYHRIPAEEDLYALFRAGATVIRRDVSSAIRMDARVPYTKGRRAALAVARRIGVSVTPSDDFDAFMELERQVLHDRYRAEPVHTAAELALLAGRFPDSISLQVATVDDRLVGGVVVYETPLVARSQYIAVSDEGREVHALDAIVDTLLSGYAERKRWWDFGPSTERDGRRLNEALIRNKESYGARAVAYDHYRLDLRA